MDNISREMLQEERQAWERSHAPDAMKDMSDEELHDYMKSAYTRHLKDSISILFGSISNNSGVRV